MNKFLIILFVLVPSLSWGKEISLTCYCDERTTKRNGNEEIKKCEGTIEIIINEEEKTMNFVGIGSYDYKEQGNFIFYEKIHKLKGDDVELVFENRSIDRVDGRLNTLSIFTGKSKDITSYNTKSSCKLTKDVDKLF